ncbi:MAG: GNAT family N-acetyltransferase [Acidimicrobiia bacterium]|nr:GNAT family N-acetyltransferase [Acidimicrobiia bacterium]
MKLHRDWSTPGFELEPSAPAVGPFPLRSYLQTWWTHRNHEVDDLIIAEDHDGLAVFVRSAKGIEFAGESDLTDYHSPLGQHGPRVVADYLSSLDAGTAFTLDSLPIEASEPISEALTASGIDHTKESHTVAAVMTLPSSFDEYLMMIGKKERHETRRKRRRFTAALGDPTVQDRPEGLDVFIDMHRRASGDKGSFMNEDMAGFFKALLEDGDADLYLLYGSGHDAPVAGAFGWDGPSGYYLYNSAYDPEYQDVSPGVVMLASLIERAIDLGHERFDFLKGDETYKFRLGASERELFVIEGQR